MGLITISGQPGCRHDEVARLTAQRLGFELVTETRLHSLIEREFGPATPISDKAYRHVLLSILARLATEHHLVVSAFGVEHVFQNFLGVLRVYVVAPEFRRIGTLMLDRRLDRPSAKRSLRQMEREESEERRRKFGRATVPSHAFDVVLNSEFLESDQLTDLIEAAARARSLVEQGLLSSAADAQLQFQARLQLSRYGIMPADAVSLKRSNFSHPSEEIFANLLDFYRVAWEYEPRSFPVKWDKDGRVLEAFTPDFYLPEFDLYVELTTMKQPLVTKKNRKVKLLREIYPEINIQVFYQKDFQNLIFKYGLTERLARV
ncbi:MAG TPA: cytidylate kinase family protein [Bryobacteraceae bacterium]|nr:cytidylate kinase family protein [Bryobacteraceae bacterium]